MDFSELIEDQKKECSEGTGDINDFNVDKCRSASKEERLCIFPFYWNEKLFDKCAFLEQDDFLIPVFRCPVRNITRKIEGVNSFYYTDILKQVSKTLGHSVKLKMVTLIHCFTHC